MEKEFSLRVLLMIRRFFQLPLIWVSLVLLPLFGCATSPVVGVLYSNVDYPKAISSNEVGPRVGRACASSVLGLVAWGDAGVERARRNGGITQISLVDQEHRNYGPFYFRSCTLVRGR